MHIAKLFLLKITAYLLISIQFLIPVLSTQPLIVRADMSPAITTGETAIQQKLPDLSASGHFPSPWQKEQQKSDVESDLASGFMQAGTLMSEDNRSAAAINYARGISEGLINQQVNDWLNQYGHAKVSVNTDGKITGDLLFPLYDSYGRLLFSQMGVRTNKERNTANLGIGYRQYLGDWMLGINSFYDDDYTGHNRRLGLGGEAWTDYLKLAINGYMRQTGWHQSRLQQMHDYDERPANGFDIRANFWLPSWPNVGGSLEYAQYVGSGVSLADSTRPDSLKNNPKIVKIGLDYTPFPLLTLSAKQAIGDARNTLLNLSTNYRFGVPWSQQTSPDSVGLIRSLTGSRYDLVDRNYDIVMQYQKQDLLRIQLPESIVAQAAETVTLTLNVDRAKYGMKDVSWDIDPELIADGGHYKVIVPTELQVTLPAYLSNHTQAQNYKIGAIATDNHGNASNRAETLLSVIPSQNIVSSLVITPSEGALIANDQDSYTITGKVTDGKGAALVGQNVTFSVLGLAAQNGDPGPGATLSSPDGSESSNSKITLSTDSKGKVVALLRSSKAGDGTVNAKMDNGSSASVAASFIADSATARVHSVHLEEGITRKVVDSIFRYTVTVKDHYGNPVPGIGVIPDLAVDPLSGKYPSVTFDAPPVTDANGQTTILMESEYVNTDITVSAKVITDKDEIFRPGTSKGVSADKKVSFVADSSKARVANVIRRGGNQTYIVTVTDHRGNPVPHITVIPTADKPGITFKTLPTDAKGQAVLFAENETGSNIEDVTVSARVGNTPSVSAEKIDFIV